MTDEKLWVQETSYLIINQHTPLQYKVYFSCQGQNFEDNISSVTGIELNFLSFPSLLTFQNFPRRNEATKTSKAVTDGLYSFLNYLMAINLTVTPYIS